MLGVLASDTDSFIVTSMLETMLRDDRANSLASVKTRNMEIRVKVRDSLIAIVVITD